METICRISCLVLRHLAITYTCILHRSFVLGEYIHVHMYMYIYFTSTPWINCVGSILIYQDQI